MSLFNDLWREFVLSRQSKRSPSAKEKMYHELRAARTSIDQSLHYLKNPIGTTGHIPDNEALIDNLEQKRREIDDLLNQYKS